MAISFNEVPGNVRVPLFYAEFDNSRAVQGLAVETHKILVFGQKTAAGSATAEALIQVGDENEASALFGPGSMLHRMFKKLRANNKTTELWAMPLADAGGSAASSGEIAVTGTATADGTLAIYAGGVKVQVGVSSGDAATDVATAIAAAVNAEPDQPFVATAVSSAVRMVAKNKGVAGNSLDIRKNYYSDDADVAGVSLAFTQPAGGSGTPSLTTAIANMTEEKWNTIVMPYSDSTSLTAIEAELLDRWGPIRQNDGIAVCAKDDTVGNLTTFGNARNSKHVVCFGYESIPNAPEEVAAAAAAQMSLSASIDPARPFQTLQLRGILPPADSDRFTWQEKNTLLTDGIAQIEAAPGGVVQIVRAITMFQKNASNVADTSYLDSETMYTLSYLRWSFKARMTSRFPRHKLAKDGIRVGPGQAILTPKSAKAECIAIFRQWEEIGLVEGIDQFKNDLIVEINAADPNRLDIRLPPDLVNQLRVLATQIQFLL